VIPGASNEGSKAAGLTLWVGAVALTIQTSVSWVVGPTHSPRQHSAECVGSSPLPGSLAEVAMTEPRDARKLRCVRPQMPELREVLQRRYSRHGSVEIHL
jgi:hypothetical protein